MERRRERRVSGTQAVVNARDRCLYDSYVPQVGHSGGSPASWNSTAARWRDIPNARWVDHATWAKAFQDGKDGKRSTIQVLTRELA
jgi:hypothetical protein